jgi:hypothetical protein
MLPPARTELGAPVLVTVRFTAAFTRVVAEATLLAGFVSLVVAAPTEAVAVMLVPFAVFALVLSATVILTGLPVLTATLGLVQLIVPVAPTAGVVHVQPAGAVTYWKVEFAGTASVKVISLTAGPPLVIACAKTMLLPAYTHVPDVAEVLIERSALLPTMLVTSLAVLLAVLYSMPAGTETVAVFVRGDVAFGATDTVTVMAG